MSWIATAVVTSAALGYMGAQDQASAMENAGKGQATASAYAADQQYKMFEEQQAAMAPWRKAGKNALGQLTGMTGPGGYFMQPFKYDPNSDPSTQFRYQQGLDSMNQNAALGGYFRGQTGIDLQNYGQGMASQEYGAAFNRDQAQKTNIYNMLAGISGTGQAATQQTGQMGMNAATNVGQFGIQGAQAMGAGQVGAASAMSGAYQNIGNQMMGGVGTYLNYKMINDYLNGQNSSPVQTWPAIDNNMNIGGGYNISK